MDVLRIFMSNVQSPFFSSQVNVEETIKQLGLTFYFCTEEKKKKKGLFFSDLSCEQIYPCLLNGSYCWTIDLNCEYCCHVIINPKSFSETSTRKRTSESLNRNFHHGEILRESMQCRVKLPCLCLSLTEILSAVVVGFKKYDSCNVPWWKFFSFIIVTQRKDDDDDDNNWPVVANGGLH